MILYNIALILQKLASQLLRDEKSTLEEVLQVCLFTIPIIFLLERERYAGSYRVIFYYYLFQGQK